MSEIICFEIFEINEKGVVAKYNNSKIFIEFEECAKNYARENFVESSKCVAFRDITRLTFSFFTKPQTIITFKKNILKNIFCKKSSVDKFMMLQKQITKYGYTSFDLS